MIHYILLMHVWVAGETCVVNARHTQSRYKVLYKAPVYRIKNYCKTHVKYAHNQECKSDVLKSQVLKRFFYKAIKPQKPNLGFLGFKFLSNRPKPHIQFLCHLSISFSYFIWFTSRPIDIMNINHIVVFSFVIREKGKDVPCMDCF